MIARRLTADEQLRRELLIETCSIAYARLLAASPRRRRLARRRQIVRMGWWRQ